MNEAKSLINRWWVKAGAVAVLFSPILLAPRTSAQTGLRPSTRAAIIESAHSENQTADARQDGAASQKEKQETAANKAKLLKSHLENGSAAMRDAQEIRHQIDAATGDERSALVAKMNAAYQTAISEYQQALANTRTADEDAIRPIGLVRLIRNGLISEQKAVEMEVQDKNLPVILSNLGMAYSGAGDYEDAIPILQEAILSRQAPATYMQLGTDLAEVGKIPEASAACDKISAVGNPPAIATQGACYRNVAVVLMNGRKPAAAVAPLQKTTVLNPNDALAWKLLGDALSSNITTKDENGRIIYVIPPGAIEAYQKYLQLEPNGVYAGQVKAELDSFAQLNKGAPTSVDTRKMP